MADIEKLVDDFVCDLNCPRNCCLESIGGIFTDEDYEHLKQSDGKILCDGSVFHLRESVESCVEGMRFRLDGNGICMFFRDNCCFLQTSLGREALPYDCREYPRNILRFMGHIDKMLDPVCPHAAEIIIRADTPFWEYMTRTIEPDPEGLFAKRREMILTLRNEKLTLQEALNRICGGCGLGQCCVCDRQFPPDIDAALRHFFACMLFGNLFYYGYDKALFESQAEHDAIVSARMVDDLSRIEDLSLDNLPVYFGKAYYNCYEQTMINKCFDKTGD